MGARSSLTQIIVSALIMAILIEFVPTEEMPFIQKMGVCLLAVLFSKLISKLLGG